MPCYIDSNPIALTPSKGTCTMNPVSHVALNLAFETSGFKELVAIVDQADESPPPPPEDGFGAAAGWHCQLLALHSWASWAISQRHPVQHSNASVIDRLRI